MTDSLIQLLEAKKYTPDQGIDAEMAASNTAIDDCIKIVERYWQAYVPVQSEISVVEDQKRLISDYMTESLMRYDGMVESRARIISDAFMLFIRPCLRTIEPVSVDLDKCENEVRIHRGNNAVTDRDLAKAILDIVGVKYVE